MSLARLMLTLPLLVAAAPPGSCDQHPAAGLGDRLASRTESGPGSAIGDPGPVPRCGDTLRNPAAEAIHALPGPELQPPASAGVGD